MDDALKNSIWVTGPESSGWLFKKGFYWRRQWKKRWVALHGTEIAYMDRQPTGPNDDLKMTTATVTSAMTIDRDDIDGDPNGFTLNINDGSTPPWHLRAETLREKKAWIMRFFHIHAIVKWLDEYEKVRVLGVGGTGIVYELSHRISGKKFAMKEMEIKSKAQMNMAMKEAEMVKDITENISHPNIMVIEKVFQIGSKFYLVFPLCTGGELYEHIIRIGNFTEADAAVVIHDLVDAIDTLHKNNILHLDIKPENILFESKKADAKIRVTDFGLSQMFETSDQGRTHVPTMDELNKNLRAFVENGHLPRDRLRGTLGYMSPELILTGSSLAATDVWAAGVVLYILLCGRPPFQSKSNREILMLSAKGQYNTNSKQFNELPPLVVDLIGKMLTVDPSKRITTEEVLNHPWLVGQLEAKKVAETSVTTTDTTNKNKNSNNTDTTTSPSSSSNTNSKIEAPSSRPLTDALHLLSTYQDELRNEKYISSLSHLALSLNSKDGLMQFRYGKLYRKLLLQANGHLPSIYEEHQNENEAYTLFPNIIRNNDIRDVFTEILNTHGEDGKFTISQFTTILKHFGIGSSDDSLTLSANQICRFADRDGDGCISIDDLLTTQAMITQRSEVFLRAIFKTYQDIIWYPGRQLNVFARERTFAGMILGPLDNTRKTEILNSSASESDSYGNVMEPPKFITAKHVEKIFETLGYDGTDGKRIFEALCSVLYLIHHRDSENSTKLQQLFKLLNDAYKEGDNMNGTAGAEGDITLSGTVDSLEETLSEVVNDTDETSIKERKREFAMSGGRRNNHALVSALLGSDGEDDDDYDDDDENGSGKDEGTDKDSLNINVLDQIDNLSITSNNNKKKNENNKRSNDTSTAVSSTTANESSGGVASRLSSSLFNMLGVTTPLKSNENNQIKRIDSRSSDSSDKSISHKRKKRAKEIANEILDLIKEEVPMKMDSASFVQACTHVDDILIKLVLPRNRKATRAKFSKIVESHKEKFKVQFGNQNDNSNSYSNSKNSNERRGRDGSGRRAVSVDMQSPTKSLLNDIASNNNSSNRNSDSTSSTASASRGDTDIGGASNSHSRHLSSVLAPDASNSRHLSTLLSPDDDDIEHISGADNHSSKMNEPLQPLPFMVDLFRQELMKALDEEEDTRSISRHSFT